MSCTDTALISTYEVFFLTLTCWKSCVHVDCYSNVTAQDFISITPTGKPAYGSLNFLTSAPIYHVNVEPLSKCDKWPETTAHTPLHSPSKWLVEMWLGVGVNFPACFALACTSNSLIVPAHVHPSLGQTAAKASTSLRAALSGKACTEKQRLLSDGLCLQLQSEG